MESAKAMIVGSFYAVTQIDILPDGQMVGNFFGASFFRRKEKPVASNKISLSLFWWFSFFLLIMFNFIKIKLFFCLFFVVHVSIFFAPTLEAPIFSNIEFHLIWFHYSYSPRSCEHFAHLTLCV